MIKAKSRHRSLQSGIDYDPFDAAVAADPYPTYRRLRDEAPCHHSPVADVYAFSRYEDVAWALADTDLFSSDAMRGVLLGKPTGTGRERLPREGRPATSCRSTRPATPSCGASSTAGSRPGASPGGAPASTSSSPGCSPGCEAIGSRSSERLQHPCRSASSPSCSVPMPTGRPTSGPGPTPRPGLRAVRAEAASTRRPSWRCLPWPNISVPRSTSGSGCPRTTFLTTLVHAHGDDVLTRDEAMGFAALLIASRAETPEPSDLRLEGVVVSKVWAAPRPLIAFGLP